MFGLKQARSRRLAAAALVALSPGVSHAAGSEPKLAVVRAQGASDCPDSDELRSLVAALARPGASIPGDVLIDAQFVREGAAYVALLRASGERSGQRRLEDPGPTCAALTEATALTIAILLDPGMTRPPAPSAAATAPPPPPPPPSKIAPEPPQPTSTTYALAAGGALSTGLTASPTGGVWGELQLRRLGGRLESGLLAGVGALWLPSRSFALSPGEIEVALLAATARGCWVRSGWWGLLAGLCGRVGLGQYRAEARGFSRNDDPRAGWVGASLTAHVSGRTWEAQLGWQASPLHRTFTIDGLGKAFDPSPWGGLWASIGASLPL